MGIHHTIKVTRHESMKEKHEENHGVARKTQTPLSGIECKCYICQTLIDTSLARYVGQSKWRCENHTEEDILRGSRYAYAKKPEIVRPGWWKRLPTFCREAWEMGAK